MENIQKACWNTFSSLFMHSHSNGYLFGRKLCDLSYVEIDEWDKIDFSVATLIAASVAKLIDG